MNLLITAAASAAAYQLEKLVKEEGAVIYLADSVSLPDVLLKTSRYIQIPSATSPSFVHQLLSLCLDLQIGKVFPLRREEVRALSAARELFAEYDIQVFVPSAAAALHLDFAHKPGSVVIKQLNTSESVIPEDIDCGVFLVHTTASDTRISIFSGDSC